MFSRISFRACITSATAALIMIVGSAALASGPYAWGWNYYGQLGDGTTTSKNVPAEVPGFEGVTAIAGGWSHSLAVSSDGSVWAWGANTYGQLGDGTTTNSLVPVQVVGLTGVVAVAAGGSHSLALKSDGTVWAWGANWYGQLGNGTTTDQSAPVQVSGLTGVVSIGAGLHHGLAVRSDGTVWTWGFNQYGQLGDGSNSNRSLPVRVLGLTSAVAAAGGYRHSAALRSDGTVWAWGWNGYGELGNGTTTDALTPVQVSGLTSAVALAAGAFHCVAALSDGTAAAWGYNYTGQLGNGTDVTSSVPVPVQGLTEARSVGAGENHSVALCADGKAWAWGDNSYGQLGDGTTTTHLTPVQVSGLASVTTVAAGGQHSMALMAATATPYIWVADKTVNLGSSTGLYAYFRTVPDLNPQPAKTVRFFVNGVFAATAVTNGDGIARCPYTPLGLTTGSYTIRCEFSGDSSVTAGYGQASLTVLPPRCYIWVVSREVYTGHSADVWALVRSLPSLTRQAGKTVTFKVDGTPVGTAVTDSQGYARVSYDTTGLTIGTHTTRFEFAGDADLDAGYGESTLTILPPKPYLWVNPRSVAAGSVTSLYVCFRTQPDLVPQADKTVTFLIDGTPVGTVVTDQNGVARCTYNTAGLSVGDHVIRCQFAGDAELAAGYGEAPLTIY